VYIYITLRDDIFENIRRTLRIRIECYLCITRMYVIFVSYKHRFRKQFARNFSKQSTEKFVCYAKTYFYRHALLVLDVRIKLIIR